MDYYFHGVYAFLASITALAIFTPLARRIGLVDIPDERKRHIGNVPLVGGISFFFATVCVILPFSIGASFGSLWLATFIVPGFVLLALGVADDLKNVKVKTRLAVQALLATVLYVCSGFSVGSLGTIFFVEFAIPSVAAYVLIVLALIAAINAFNMIDGLDGQLSGVVAASLAGLALLFGRAGVTEELAVLGIVMVGAILAFCWANLRLFPFSEKIFSGDAGSMTAGFAILWLLIAGSQPTFYTDVEVFAPVTALWIIGIPFLDMVRVMVFRAKKGTSPFQGGRDHIHHVLIQRGYSNYASAAIVVSLHALFVVLGIFMHMIDAPDSVQLLTWGLASAGIFQLVRYLSRPASSKAIQAPSSPEASSVDIELSLRRKGRAVPETVNTHELTLSAQPSRRAEQPQQIEERAVSQSENAMADLVFKH